MTATMTESMISKRGPANTKHLYNICTTAAQRLRRWSTIVQMLCKCFVFPRWWERDNRRGMDRVFDAVNILATLDIA